MENLKNLVAKQYINSKNIQNTPVYILNSTHIDKIICHFEELSKSDRRLRFGFPINSDGIKRYVNNINFDKKECLGYFDKNGDIKGVAHLSQNEKDYVAELGVSVNKALQGKGIGFSLLIHSAHWAKYLGYDFINIECLNNNIKIINWVKKAGFPIQRIGFEALAVFPTIKGPLPLECV